MKSVDVRNVMYFLFPCIKSKNEKTVFVLFFHFLSFYFLLYLLSCLLGRLCGSFAQDCVFSLDAHSYSFSKKWVASAAFLLVPPRMQRFW